MTADIGRRLPRALLFCLVPAAIVRILFVLGAPPVVWPDSHAYFEWAERLAEGVQLLRHPIYRTPLYPLFLSLVLRFDTGAAASTAIMVLQHLIGLLSACVVYFIARSVFDAKVAFFAAFFFGLHTLQLYYEHVLQTEVLFVALHLLSAAAAVRFFQEPGAKSGIHLGLALGLAALARPIAQPLIVLLVLLLFLKERRKALLPGAAAFAVFTLTVLPWCLVNVAAHDFFGLSRELGINLYHRVYDVDKAEIAAGAPRRIKKTMKRLNVHGAKYFYIEKDLRRGKVSARNTDSLMLKAAAAAISENPVRYSVNTVKIWGSFFLSPANSVHFCHHHHDNRLLCPENETRHIPAVGKQAESRLPWAAAAIKGYLKHARLPMPAVSIVAFLGMSLLAARKTFTMPRLYFALLILYFSSVTALLNSPEDRFRLPIDAFLLMFCVFFVQQAVLRAAPRLRAAYARYRNRRSHSLVKP